MDIKVIIKFLPDIVGQVSFLHDFQVILSQTLEGFGFDFLKP